MKALLLLIITISSLAQASKLDDLEKKLTKSIEFNSVVDEASEIFMLKSKFKDFQMSNGVFLLKGYAVEKFTKEMKENFEKNKLDQNAQNFFKQNFSNDSHGSGFYYRGYIVTNFHVCRGQNVLAKGYDGDISTFKIVKYNSAQDICILSPNFKKDRYFDFAILNPAKDRQLAEAISYNPKDVYTIDSIYGKIQSNKIKKDDVKDQWSKDNTYFTNNLKKDECRGGISGSPVVGPHGFFGLAWGASTNEDEQNKQFCFLIEKKSIDDLINSI